MAMSGDHVPESERVRLHLTPRACRAMRMILTNFHESLQEEIGEDEADKVFNELERAGKK